MANPRGNIGSLQRAKEEGTPLVPLATGEASRPVRVRADQWVFDALKGMPPAEVGKLLAGALLARQTAEPTPEPKQGGELNSGHNLRGKVAELWNALQLPGVRLVEVGNAFEVRRGEELVQKFAGATAGALKTRGLIWRDDAGDWYRVDA